MNARDSTCAKNGTLGSLIQVISGINRAQCDGGDKGEDDAGDEMDRK